MKLVLYHHNSNKNVILRTYTLFDIVVDIDCCVAVVIVDIVINVLLLLLLL